MAFYRKDRRWRGTISCRFFGRCESDGNSSGKIIQFGKSNFHPGIDTPCDIVSRTLKPIDLDETLSSIEVTD